ncbi:putative disease resistance RPP13-like protein 1 [Coffea arabica]|uniref:Disease resistance RPP13-like protein 1 n=1 Tax=Coffea arabica TaxID=13443 RepID=A0A6P6WES4_COFAR|nr:putative disease resistance RPP13-like protein 1 [Coffea arabica]XP_027113926.1 putative disease resistance RPP13-like protein 1 [Coffea arabica]XP_027113928.1 putative disease resistance RPP13-like protein 1 [Coffea arabica]XP_027113929.1 putative disease resistance RPP13-like protein 1 [Coffea arabica]XP_027113930.1 putative disease resistance RPP13-like protein 1 [Coffea arabica]XP_027113931.1 putative disease resistance RPP13-like protein 1 [Coffea arabica]XP_027113932.1 putative disea
MADVALAMGSSVLSAFLQVVFDRMATKEFLNLFRGRENDGELLEKLKLNLQIVGDVLDDAENKQTSSLAVKGWLNKLHDTIYEADDLLDEINTEALRLKVEAKCHNSTSQVSALNYSSSFSNDFLGKMMPQIEKMVARLDWFIQQINPMGLRVIEPKRQSCRTPSTSLVDEATVYGRDADKEKIIKMLLSESANGVNFTVISVVGLGGIGKTTLAQLIYKDNRVQNHFPTKAWVCISEDYDAARITKELLGELGIPFSDMGENLNSLQMKLQLGLTQKKFLLVLDDFWNRDYSDWDRFKVLFTGAMQGSKIIVTTRDEKIALMMCKKESIYSLDLIAEEDCCSLFEKHAFENIDGDQRLELEDIGKKIVKKCARLPLAVKTVAGLLRSKTTAEEWEDILVSEVWTQTDNEDDILPALRLSYSHLPSRLKRCFACCAVFHKDFQFKKEEIIHLWQANDLLEPPGENRGIEQIGEEYLRELRLRSLLEQSTNGLFSMHDLVNDLAIAVSRRYCYRLEDNDPEHGKIGSISYFSYHPSSFHDTFHKFELLRETKNLRTFLPLSKRRGGKGLSHKFLHEMLPKFRSLRFLSLLFYKIHKLPDSISDLKHLRLLNLSSTPLETLPECICALYNLQTLLLSDCEKLEELPVSLAKLINLSYLDISGTPLKKMPLYMSRLRNLRVLTNFIVGKDSGSMIEELGKFPKLRGRLFISKLENVCSGRDASMANLKGKKHLDELTLEWNGAINDSQAVRDVLDNLQPHSSIKHLKIIGYGGTTFPDWLGNSSLSHLESLSLSNCENCFSLPALGQLESLQSLEIFGMDHISDLAEDFYGDISATKPFPSLKKLRIEKLPEWERWYIPEGEVFNRLKKLSIIDCPKLIGELPQQLASLQSLEISGCDNLVCPSGRLSIFNEEIRQKFSSLRELKISALKNLTELPLQLNQLFRLTVDDCGSLLPSHVSRLPASLYSLEYKGCCNLELESSSGEDGGALERLILENCDTVKVKVEWLASFPMLKRVQFYKCKSVEMLSVPAAPAPGIGNQSGMTTTTTTSSTSSVMASLQHLHISGCDDLMSFRAPSLTELYILDCEKLTSLPQRMESLLPSLRYLYLGNCPEIECFPEGGLPSTLQALKIFGCKKLVSRRREWGLEKLPSLTESVISGPCDEVESFPEEDWLLPCTLQYLHLNYLQNLKVLNYSALRHLTSLQNLGFNDCPRLQSLPEEGLPASLTELRFSKCPLLKPRLEWEKGQDWPKVAHIPCVKVDGQLIP